MSNINPQCLCPGCMAVLDEPDLPCPLCGFDKATTFSFHPVKHITTAEGGMVVTNSRELYEKLMLYRTHGITRDESMMTKNDGPWYYEQAELGYNYRMTDVQCALGLSQL